MIEADAAAHLQPLRDLARNGEFAALALLLNVSNHRKPVREYLHGRLFAVIINNHPSFLDEPKVAAWSREAGKQWSAAIARCAADTQRLPGLVDNMLADLKTWRPGDTDT